MVISISKIRKIKLIIKKWILKGIWLGAIGSKPHSKGEIFSREDINFFVMVKLMISRALARARARNMGSIIMSIIYIKFFLNILIGN